LKAYGELPETAKINETDTFGPGEEDDNVEFDDVEDVDIVRGGSPRPFLNAR
jgi:translation initiation factor 1A